MPDMLFDVGFVWRLISYPDSFQIGKCGAKPQDFAQASVHPVLESLPIWLGFANQWPRQDLLTRSGAVFR